MSAFSALVFASGCQATSGVVAGAAGSTTTATTATTSSTAATALVITPTTETISPGATIQVTASGGTAPYVYSVLSGGGTISSSGGTYTASSTPSVVEISAEDSAGSTVYSTITVATSSLALRSNIAVSSALQFTATGGSSPYSYAVVSGAGSITSPGGLYSAPAASGDSVISVTDSNGYTVYESIIIGSGAASTTLSLSPAVANLASSSMTQLVGSGGTAPYTYSVAALGNTHPGSIISSSGLYTAPATAGTVVFTVTDSAGNLASSYAYVSTTASNLQLNSVASLNATFHLTATGGLLPYTYEIASGVGSIVSASGLFTASSTSGITEIAVEDATGAVTYETITVGAGNTGGSTVITPSTSPVFTGVSLTSVASGAVKNGATGLYPVTFVSEPSLITGTGCVTTSTAAYVQNPIAPPYVIASFSVLTAISQLDLTAKLSAGVPVWFPSVYQIYVTDQYNSSWVYVGNVVTGSGSGQVAVNAATGVAAVSLGATFDTWGVMVVADTLVLSTAEYAFELCKIAAQ